MARKLKDLYYNETFINVEEGTKILYRKITNEKENNFIKKDFSNPESKIEVITLDLDIEVE